MEPPVWLPRQPKFPNLRLAHLLLLDPGQHLAETLVLKDGRVAHALQVVKDGVQPALRISIDGCHRDWR
jgi:hypothetical protein